GRGGAERAANGAAGGVWPETPTFCGAQPPAFAPWRCRDGAAILGPHLPECPRRIKGDAAGRIHAPADGLWSPAIREAYAHRVEAILAHHIDGFADSIIGRRAYSPRAL